MQLTIYDHSNITEDIIENFRKLHIKIAEKETRSQKTWAIQYKMIKAIEYCKAMDKKKFILGDIYENQSTHCDKEKSIANFKRYFTNIIENYICFDGVIKYS